MGNQNSNAPHSCDPGPSHCEPFNSAVRNGEDLLDTDNGATAGGFVINTLQATQQWRTARDHSDHGPGCSQERGGGNSSPKSSRF